MLLFLCTGRLMCTETLRVMHPHGSEYRPALVNPKQCYWKEMPTSRKTVVLCLRVYILINQQQEETESIGTYTHYLYVIIGYCAMTYIEATIQCDTTMFL